MVCAYFFIIIVVVNIKVDVQAMCKYKGNEMVRKGQKCIQSINQYGKLCKSMYRQNIFFVCFNTMCNTNKIIQMLSKYLIYAKDSISI